MSRPRRCRQRLTFAVSATVAIVVGTEMDCLSSARAASFVCTHHRTSLSTFSDRCRRLPRSEVSFPAYGARQGRSTRNSGFTPSATAPREHGQLMDFAIDIDGDGDEDHSSTARRKLVTANATIVLPFSSSVAFDAFSDLPRQPSWSPWLRSVTYLDGNDDNRHDGRASESPRDTKWTLRIKGIKLGWTARGTKLVRPREIGWVSTSGVRNGGSVLFEPLDDNEHPCDDSDSLAVLRCDDDIEEITNGVGRGEFCKMTLTMAFVAPRAVAMMFRKSSALEAVFRERMLMGTLKRFRDVVLSEDVLRSVK